ncbi:YkvI family membrane protein [Neomoorella carbonis]|uniref:YkvI family membrane protein n=1 Tax=Neomoorella carbonis TaxID=3062783 RepID=UPI0032506E43
MVLILRAELAVAIAVVGTMVGAGFASGQELVQFFVMLGPEAPAAVMLMGTLLILATSQVRRLALKWHTNSYHDFLVVLLGKWEKPADLATGAFLFGGLAIMLAGSGAVVQEHFGLAPLTGIMACGVLAFLASLGKGHGLLLINAFLVPVMLAIIIVTAVIAVFFRPGPFHATPPASPGGLISSNWVLNACLYVTYNMVGIAVLLTSLPASRKGVLGAGLGGLFLGVLAYLLVKALRGLSPAGLQAELPLLYLVSGLQPGLVHLYALALWLAIVTTAASNLYGLATRLGQIPALPPWRAAVLILILALPVATCGFINLVSWIYPFFGYLGLVMLFLALVCRL